MGVSNNMDAIGAFRGKATNRADSSDSIGKISSGQKINSSSDDAAGVAISENLRSVAGGLSLASQNAQAGVSLVQTAESGLSGSADILSRMKELAVQASNGTYGDSDRTALNKEFSELKKGLDQIATSTEYNGQKLLNGSSNSISLQVGQSADDASIGVSIGNMTSNSLGVGSLDIGTLDGASGAIDALSSAIDHVSETRGDLGATQNRLESSISNLEYSGQNIASAETTIRDIDMAKEIMNKAQQSIKDDASTAIAAQGMNLMRQNATSILLS